MTTRRVNDTVLDGDADADWDTKTGTAINPSGTNAIDGTSYRWLGTGQGGYQQTFLPDHANVGGRGGKLLVRGQFKLVTDISSDYAGLAMSGVIGAAIVPGRLIRLGLNFLGTITTDYVQSSAITLNTTYVLRVEYQFSGQGKLTMLRLWLDDVLTLTFIKPDATTSLAAQLIGVAATKATGELVWDNYEMLYVPAPM